MTITVVQTLSDPQNNQSATNQTKTLANPVGAGNALIDLAAYLDSSNNTSFPTSPTDPSASFTLDARQATQSHDSSSIYSSFNNAGGVQTVTNNKGTAATAGQVNWTSQLMEVSGLVATDQAYGANTAKGASTGPLTISTSVSINAGDFVVAMCEVNASVTGLTIPAGWTPIGSTGLLNSSFPSGAFAYFIVTTAGIQTANFGTISTVTNWSIAIVAYPSSTANPPGSASIYLNVTSARNVSRPGYNSSVANGFFVLNGKLYDPNGYLFQIRGLNRVHFNSNPWAGGINGALTGANCVRITCDPYDNPTLGSTMAVALSDHIDNDEVAIISQFGVNSFLGVGSVTGSVLTVTSVVYGSLAVNYVIYCGASNQVTITSFGSGSGGIGTYNLGAGAGNATSRTFVATTNNNNGLTSGNNSLVDFASVQNWWVQMAPVFTPYNNRIIVNPLNEWGVQTWAGGGLTEAQWSTSYQGMISALRSAGYTCPILIDALGFGQDLVCIQSYGAAVLASDPLKNIIFDTHLYGSNVYESAISSISVGATTTITLSTTATPNPFGFGNLAAYVQGISGTLGAAMNGVLGSTMAINSSGGSVGAWTVTTAFNSTGLTGSGGTCYDSANIFIRLPVIQGFIASGLCCISGEFGPPGLNGVSVGMGEFVAACEGVGLGWIAWAWDDNNLGGGNTSWSGWFGETLSGPGTYALNAPSGLTQPGMAIALDPRNGLSALATPAAVFI